MSVWFITGASRGFGLEIARQALAQGHQVVATGRDVGQVEAALSGEQVLAVGLDVTDEAQTEAAVKAAVARFGRIDVLVNNAGRGLLGAVEEASGKEVEAVFATNVFGLLAVTRAVLPVMRAQRSGRIVNMSSVGGFVQFPGWGVYGATKFAVEGLSEAMRGELAPLGIDVVIVEPGSFRTDFLGGSSLSRTDQTIDDYESTVGSVRAWATNADQAQVNDPIKGAAAIITIGTIAQPPLRLQLGADSVALVEGKLAQVAAEMEMWRELATSTAHHDTTH
ncbi:oxidoreductase [Arthrobacter sp. TMN-49]